MQTKTNVSTETLKEMYEQGTSTAEIARQINCSTTNVYARLRRAGCDTRRYKHLPKTSTEELRRLYFDERKSSIAIAKLRGFRDHGSILKRLQRAGFTTRRKIGPGEFCDPLLAPTKHPEMKDIYWAAGFYEGEGSYVANKQKTKVTGSGIKIMQKQKWPLEYMRDFFGGSLCLYTKKSGTKVGQQYWWWTLHGPRARGFIMTIYSLLSPRRQGQIRKVFDGVRDGYLCN
jgi:hypothetical protein